MRTLIVAFAVVRRNELNLLGKKLDLLIILANPVNRVPWEVLTRLKIRPVVYNRFDLDTLVTMKESLYAL
jgi:hypothetical protein